MNGLVCFFSFFLVYSSRSVTEDDWGIIASRKVHNQRGLAIKKRFVAMPEMFVSFFIHSSNWFAGEHIKNWRHRYFVLLDDGSLLGFKNKPEAGLAFAEPLNNFTVKGCQIMKAVSQLDETTTAAISIICDNLFLLIRIVLNPLLSWFVDFSGPQWLKEPFM